MWQPTVDAEADWSQESPEQVLEAWGEWTDAAPEHREPERREETALLSVEQNREEKVAIPADTWVHPLAGVNWDDHIEPVAFVHAGYRYKRTIDPVRVVVGYLGDFGKDIPYMTRGEMMQAVRVSVRFCEQWLREFVLRPQVGHFHRLQRNTRQQTREPRYRDLLEYERYLRWNVEYRFPKIALREVKVAVATTGMPLDHLDIVLGYLF